MLIKPTLFVVAGCNGSGKSTFSSTFTSGTITPFDYDKHFLEIYNSKFDFELRDTMSHNQTLLLLQDSIACAIENNNNFCYETNFHADPMYWPKIFKQKKYKIHLIYFCLNSFSEAKRRVKIRHENKGHYVPDAEVEQRFRLGYKNLDLNFKKFDAVDLFDSSGHSVAPTHILSISNGNIDTISQFPEYIKDLLPKLTKSVNKYLGYNI